MSRLTKEDILTLILGLVITSSIYVNTYYMITDAPTTQEEPCKIYSE